MRREAGALGLAGWVRNRPEGTVEVVAEGPETVLRRLAERLRQGPPQARVEGIEIEEQPATGEFSGFSVGHLV